ncbi:hypothetical protein HEQ60_09810 [Haematospirillum sp. H1815]|uniref:hypothetical protein n=1 Tax=Haematospirillum sp. H1815 TaxID=2723108 RepID=UPI00143BCE0D|nr:hypothetical protein [Haematospirillum sp. H1815]NKD78052.1 hypothetical protein [Haematospirillum sp. H1815]
MNTSSQNRAPENDTPPEEWQAKVAGANISQQTLLATDYLNHFNEIVMLMDILADMPELLEECLQWTPKSYQEHFRDSSFSDKELAIEAYNHVPARYKRPFEDTVAQMDSIVQQSLERVAEAVKLQDQEIVRARAKAGSTALQRLIDVASSIIHGRDAAMDQSQIDEIFRHL